ncbi:hypothetical protein ACTXT7_006475, partial [Hymenolepis weldensis]
IPLTNVELRLVEITIESIPSIAEENIPPENLQSSQGMQQSLLDGLNNLNNILLTLNDPELSSIVKNEITFERTS